MKNKTTTYKWAYLPFVFSSAAILATQATAGPSGSQRYQDAKQVNSVSHEYVGGDHSIGFGVDDEGNVDAEFNAAISRSDNHRTGVGLWAGYDLEGDNTGILGRGGEVNHAWVSRDAAGRATHVNKTFVAYDRDKVGHDKATVGYGQENEHLFWDGRVSKGLSGGENNRTIGGNVVTDRAYDWGVGATVGKYLPNANARIRAGIDHEWSNKVGAGEKDARNTTLSAGIEKFFQGTGHSLSLDVAGSKDSGGYRAAGHDDTDVTGRLGYKFDFGGSSIYQPDRRYRRVRVEVPGQAVPPRYAKKQQYKKVPTYKTVPTYGNKTVRTPTKQLVKSTMELEGQTFFKLNSSKLIPSAQTRLKQIAAQIRRTGYKGSIRITGNTCGLGDPRYDQILSEKRAKEVRNFLIKNGFNPNHLIARGLGKGHPKYPRTPDQDFKNRRVDIEYVSQQQVTKTGYKTENKRVQTGTRRVATGFKNVPAGMKNVLISNGRPGAPRVIWKTEAIPTSPAWIKRALNNTIVHDRNVNTYTTSYGNEVNEPRNSGPDAVNDSVKTECGNPISINVLGNDTDPENDALTITSFTQPANGIVTRGANGGLLYTPNAGAACGIVDSFTYTISDGNGGTDTATVDITVDAPVVKNTDPIAVDDTATTTVGQAVMLTTLSNDSDPEGDTLTITSVGTPSNGTAVIVGGEIRYTPNPGFVGTDTFEYTISDGNGGTATATETVVVTGPSIPVNNAPVAVDDTKTIECGGSSSINVLGNDKDPDGDALIVKSFTQPANGKVTRGANGLLVYTSNGKNCDVDDTFTYTITDPSGAVSTATVTISLKDEPNKDPVALDDSTTTGQGQSVILPTLANDSDPDGDNLTITSIGPVANGKAEIVGGTIKYTPNAGFVGTEKFTYTISDGNGGTATATEIIVVTAKPNKPPVAKDDIKSTECSAITINVLDNDTDPDGDTLSVFSVDADSLKYGTVMQSGNQIIYTPSETCGKGNIGVDKFSYTISDGNGNTDSATVTVDVKGIKDGGGTKANSDDALIDAGETITLNVLANDTGKGLRIIAVDNPKNGSVTYTDSTVTYTPDAGFTGTDTFWYDIVDENGYNDAAMIIIDVLKGCVKGYKCD